MTKWIKIKDDIIDLEDISHIQVQPDEDEFDSKKRS